MNKVVKGTKPADLPVQQPMCIARGLTFPPSILTRADQVIQ